MNFGIDDWFDWWRILNIVICLIATFLLARRYANNSDSWNQKTLDYWYALVMWTVSGAAFSIEGIIRDSPLGPRVVLLFIAAAVTLRGLTRKGSWGSNAS